MGKSKGKKKGKTKVKKGKKGTKEVTEVEPPPPELDIFFWVRRKMTSILIETHQSQTIPELKEIISGIIKEPVGKIGLFFGKQELVDTKKGEGQTQIGSVGKDMKIGQIKGKSKGKKSKSKSKGKKKEGKGGGSGSSGSDDKNDEAGAPAPPPPKGMTVGECGFTPKNASLIRPATIALVLKDDNGNKEGIEITPWTEPAKIPDNVKPFLRNYSDTFAGDIGESKSGSGSSGKSSNRP